MQSFKSKQVLSRYDHLTHVCLLQMQVFVLRNGENEGCFVSLPACSQMEDCTCTGNIMKKHDQRVIITIYLFFVWRIHCCLHLSILGGLSAFVKVPNLIALLITTSLILISIVASIMITNNYIILFHHHSYFIMFNYYLCLIVFNLCICHKSGSFVLLLVF